MKRFLPLVVACVLLVLGCATGAFAQTHRVHIRVVSSEASRVKIDLELPAPIDSLSFPNTYAGVLGLAERLENIEALEADGSVPIRKLAPGEYQAEAKFTRVSYEATIREPAQPAAMSHVSWLSKDQGLLMLADLLPRSVLAGATVIEVDTPPGWSVTSNMRRQGREYVTTDPGKGVFLVGASLREKTKRIETSDLSLFTAAKWPFSEDDAIDSAAKLVKEYSNLTGHVLAGNSVIMLIPFPGEAGPESWSAETRGNAVVLVLGRKASRKKVLAKLGIVLSHEIFHLWVPNALSLAGDYDWFFEGFTLYQALRTDLRLGLISFDTFLNTLARVYSTYLASAGADRLSLLEASERRWTIGPSVIYNKGMLVAFIYDLKLRNVTDCQSSLADVYRQLFRSQAGGQKSGNETIIKTLIEPTGMNSFARDYIETGGRLDLEFALTSYGLQLRRDSQGDKLTTLGIAKKLSQAQKKALRCLGYRG